MALMLGLPAFLEYAVASVPAYKNLLRGIEPSLINSREKLSKLPLLRKSELISAQQSYVEKKGADSSHLFGGFTPHTWGTNLPNVFASPGRLYEPRGVAQDYWRMARAVFAAGFRSGDLVHNSFSYHFVPAGSMMEQAAQALGCSVFPAGVGQTEQQIQAMVDLQPTGYIGTPSFLKIIIEKATEMQVSALSIKKALVSGEACPPSLTTWFATHGVDCYQCYASADLGLIAYETTARAGLVVNEDIILEIVKPGTAELVEVGEVGEVVVTTLNPIYPLIRFATGDLSKVLPGPCPSGRTNVRLQGWMGRADQNTKVRGMFVHPAQIWDVIRKFPDLKRARLIVSGEMAEDQILLKVESQDTSEALKTQLSLAFREATKLRTEVALVELDSLPKDGIVIQDTRKIG